ncbi:hypothetical protein ADN00_08125 [Ornatilinea apprima]|uniref:LysM domain-containing protein n=1 Tax=Ornatilinea apprima TaxID=1134406 RepID=A0A0P6X456_9CHLR|nr:LysM peptidoglycan-binding domain-containing protein [Ornatilinea apprima]KPL77841.1 hypothetical protein ADN00_08125 [Ornatilinea apprima]
MKTGYFLQRAITFITLTVLGVSGVAGCTTGPDEIDPQWQATLQITPANLQPIQPDVAHSILSTLLPPTRVPGSPYLTPTPDPTREQPTLRIETLSYYVQPGDSLAQIAWAHNVSVEALIQANQLLNPDVIEVGQLILIPPPTPRGEGPSFKIIPDSELVNGPLEAIIDFSAWVERQGGRLSSYQMILDEEPYTGAEVLLRIAREYSVNPRLLAAILEYQSGWVTNANPPAEFEDYPFGYFDPQKSGLYHQAAWAANLLNRGYYLWKINAISGYVLTDGSVVPPSPAINAATAGVQNLFSHLYNYDGWLAAVSENGLFSTYRGLYGYPFDFSIDPLLPADLIQPPMQLPFEPGAVWSFTGGPHGGWGDGSAWAAIDFAPPGGGQGCVPNDAWVTAVADGVVTYAKNGLVLLDLDGDGLEHTGWTVVYLHIASYDRVNAGDTLRTGDRIGHASCEGGFSTGTHIHLARRYNGEWIAADGDLPFNLDGWISQGAGVEYNGSLVKSGQSVEALDYRSDANQIWR